MDQPPPKPLEWIGSSLDDLSGFPPPVKRTFGFALRAAQNGARSLDAVPLKGFGGAGVLEIIEDFDGDTYRAVYTVKFAGVVYVLHAFQKKSKHGIKTPQHEMEVIRRRLETARRMHEERGTQT
ncbi:MAG: type II toxin-antitoxin system RelE/ParE family toxin [Gemmatimonadetes bacterium]|nr:type II toxin-antitoxin system RelE/ParE family toxin [Gemmatimonadota bacterium]